VGVDWVKYLRLVEFFNGSLCVHWFGFTYLLSILFPFWFNSSSSMVMASCSEAELVQLHGDYLDDFCHCRHCGGCIRLRGGINAWLLSFALASMTHKKCDTDADV
jgi:hypothetical protein